MKPPASLSRDPRPEAGGRRVSEGDADRIARRNFRLGVGNGVLFNVGETFVDPSTVLALLVGRLTSQSWLVGLAVSMTEAGWYLPQVLTIHFLERRSRRMPLYRAMAALRITGLLAALCAVVVWGDAHPEVTLPLFLLGYAVFSFAGGFAAVSFYDVLGRTVPLNRHPTLWARRLFYGGIVAALCGAPIKALLALPDFVTRFGSLFALGTVFIAAGAILWTMADEPPVEVSRKEMHMAAHLRESARAAWRDPAFRALHGTRVALAGASVATPFFTLFAIRQLGLPVGVAAGFLTARIVGYVGANPLWQRVATRQGSRALMRVVALLAAAAPVLVLVTPLVPPAGPWRAVVLALAFVLVGAAVAGTNIGYQSLLLSIAPAARRPSYVGLMNSFVGPAMALPALGGWFADRTHPAWLFAIAVGSGLVAYGLAARLPHGPAEEAPAAPGDAA